MYPTICISLFPSADVVATAVVDAATTAADAAVVSLFLEEEICCYC